MLEQITDRRVRLRYEALVIFIINVLIFASGLGHREFFSSDARFVLAAQEMWQHGIRWFPTHFGVLDPSYSGLTTFFIYLCSLPWGYVSKIAAVLPSALLCASSLSFTYLLVAPFAKKWGLFAVLFALLTYSFLASARGISLLPYGLFVTIASFYYVYSRQLYRRRLHWIFVGLLFLFGFLSQGPVALAIPSIIIGIHCLLIQQRRQFWQLIVTSISAAIAGCALLLALAYYEGGLDFVNAVWEAQLTPAFRAYQLPWFYYIYNSLGTYALSYPLALLVVLCYLPRLWVRQASHYDILLRSCVVWVVIVTVFFTLFPNKSTSNLLIIVPPLSVLSAYLFIAADAPRYVVLLRKTIAWLLFVFPMISAVLAQLTQSELERRGLHLAIDFNIIILILVLIQVIAVALCLIYHSGAQRELIATITAAAVFIVVMIMIIEPIQLSLTQSRHFVYRMELLRAQHHGNLAFYRADRESLVMRYVMNSQLPLNAIIDITQPSELADLTSAVDVIMTEENLASLPAPLRQCWHIQLRGRIGHDEVIALRNGCR